MAAVGVGVDVTTWITPHYVVWGLRLRLAHKLAITVIFAFGILFDTTPDNVLALVLTRHRTIVIGAFRITAITDFSFGGISTNLLWTLAQMSTGIIVACLPHMRPAFEKVMPSQFTRISKRSTIRNSSAGGGSQAPRRGLIAVTTRIEVGGTLPFPALSVPCHDGNQGSWAPTFEVVKTLAVPQQHTMLCREGPPRAVGCCCLRA